MIHADAELLRSLARSLTYNSEAYIKHTLHEIAGRIDKPINMVLFCPQCHTQHIDAPKKCDACQDCGLGIGGLASCPICCGGTADGWWTNPPHRKHLCAVCGTLWKPANVPTNGMQSLD